MVLVWMRAIAMMMVLITVSWLSAGFSRILMLQNFSKILIKIQSLSQYTDQVLMYKNRV